MVVVEVRDRLQVIDDVVSNVFSLGRAREIDNDHLGPFSVPGRDVPIVDNDLRLSRHALDHRHVDVDGFHTYFSSHPHEQIRIRKAITAALPEDFLCGLVGKPVVRDGKASQIDNLVDDRAHFGAVIRRTPGDVMGDLADLVIDLEGDNDLVSHLSGDAIVIRRGYLVGRVDLLLRREAGVQQESWKAGQPK